MAENKTRPTGASVEGYIASRASEQQRIDCRELMALLEKVTQQKPRMWGPSIIGFGHHVFGTGSRKAEWMLIAFAPRKANLTLYLWPQFDSRSALLDKLGRHSCGKGCVYIKRLADVHEPTLVRLIAESVTAARADVNR